MPMISNEELLKTYTGGRSKKLDALINQPTDSETFSNSLVRGVTGLFSNIDNITGNIADVINLDRNSNVINKIRVLDNPIDAVKAFFDTPTTKGGLSQIMDLADPVYSENILQAKQDADREHKSQLKKQALAGQYSNGNFGEVLGDLALSIPISKIGNMARTNKVIAQGNATALDKAKAMAKDSLENMSTLGSSEYALQKAYGKTDDEAMSDAIGAIAIGGLGTVALSSARHIATKSLQKEAEFMGEQAGGGTQKREDSVPKQEETRTNNTEDTSPSENKQDDFSLEEVDSFKDGRLASNKDGKIKVKKVITKDDLKKHMQGNNGQVSEQKKATSEYMKKNHNIDIDKIVDSMTDEQAKKFVIEHERAHSEQDAYFKKKGSSMKEQYFKTKSKTDNKYMSESAIKIEANANKRALAKMGLISDKIATEHTPRQLIDMKDKLVSLEKNQSKIKNQSEELTERQVEALDNIESEVERISKELSDSGVPFDVIKKWKNTELSKKDTGFKKQKQDLKTSFKEQTSTDKEFKEFNDIETGRKVFKAEEGRDAEQLIKLTQQIPKKKMDDFQKLHDSDYDSIKGIDEKSKANVIKDSEEYMTPSIERAIEASARGIGKESEQFGYYAKNANELIKRFGLDKKYHDNIDQLISIKAMDINDGWKVVDKYKGDKDFDMFNDIVRAQKDEATFGIFADNPDDIIKGYRSQLFKGNKRPATKEELEKNASELTKYDAENKFEDGVLGSELETSKRGSKVDIDSERIPENLQGDKLLKWLRDNKNEMSGLSKKYIKMIKDLESKSKLSKKQEKLLTDLYSKGHKDYKFDSVEQELEFMHNNRLRKTKDGYRRVADEEMRQALGQDKDLAQVLTETSRKNEQKLKQQGLVLKTLQKLHIGDSEIISTTPKKGMVELTKEQKASLPYELRKELNYIHKDFVDKMLGRKEVRLINMLPEKYHSQGLKIADRLLSNLSTLYKQNIVLKNPASYINALLVNQTIGMSAGMNIVKLGKLQKKAFIEHKEMKKLLAILHKQKVTGKQRDKIIAEKLKNNTLYQMERAGLSTNRIEGLIEKNDLLGSMLKDNINKHIYETAKQLNLGKDTKIGKASLNLFSDIDTAGRYSLAQHFMDNGMSMKDAVTKANGLFGDMDKMVASSIELTDKYGFLPFMKWYSLTTPQLLKLTKDNPVKAMALGVIIYILGKETGTNLSTVNPVESAIDFAESSTDMPTLERAKKRIVSNAVPSVIKNAYKNPSTLGLNKLRKKRIAYEPYKGFTQSSIEKLTGNK